MIVRNEIQTLRSAVESVRGLADEVVVLDTGSDDGTPELAQDLGCVVLTGGDRMDKGGSRNKAAEASQGDWTVILDADERVADPAGFRAFLEGTDAQAVYITLAYMDGDKPTLTYAQMRAWRRGTYRYQYRAHEVPVPVNGWGKTVNTDFVWEHRPPTGRGWKSDYTLERLKLDVAENPGASRPLYYLGRQHIYRGEYVEAERRLLDFLATDGWRDRADAWELLSRCPGRDKVSDLFQACAAQPMRRDWWGLLAEHYHEQGQDAIAAGLLKCALEIPPDNDSYLNLYWHGSVVHDLLGRCLYKLGRYAEGYEHAKKAAEMEPQSERLRTNLQWFVKHLGGEAEADYYDLVFRQIVQDEGRMAPIRAVAKAVAPRCDGSVLDLGCGLGLLSDEVGGKYTGVDFCAFALEWAAEHTKNPLAAFHRADLKNGHWWAGHGTVVLAEVLEHVQDPAVLLSKARVQAERRLVVTVPVDMPDPAHVRPAWTEDDLRALMPNCRVEKITGGSRWLAVEDVA